MSNIYPGVEWSPADRPEASAVSEARAWCEAVTLCVNRLSASGHDQATRRNAEQLDARFLVLALAQLLTAEKLARTALVDVEAATAVRSSLSAALARYEVALPHIQEMRNALVHYDEWALGGGRGEQRAAIRGGVEARDVAAHFWTFVYDLDKRLVKLGPLVIEVDLAVPAAREFVRAIYVAAKVADHKRSDPPRAADTRAP